MRRLQPLLSINVQMMLPLKCLNASSHSSRFLRRIRRMHGSGVILFGFDVCAGSVYNGDVYNSEG